MSIAITFEMLNTNYEVRTYSNNNKHKKYEKSVLRKWHLISENVRCLRNFLFALQFVSTSNEEPNH